MLFYIALFLISLFFAFAMVMVSRSLSAARARLIGAVRREPKSRFVPRGRGKAVRTLRASEIGLVRQAIKPFNGQGVIAKPWGW